MFAGRLVVGDDVGGGGVESDRPAVGNAHTFPRGEQLGDERRRSGRQVREIGLKKCVREP